MEKLAKEIIIAKEQPDIWRNILQVLTASKR